MTSALDPFSMLEVSLEDNSDMDTDHPMNVVSACYENEEIGDPEIEEIILPQTNGIECDPLMTDDDVLIPSDIEVINFSSPRDVVQVPDSYRRNDAIEALKTVSFGEHSFRQNRFPAFNVVAQYRLHCTMCDVHIGCAPNKITTMFAHVHLRVLICQLCYTSYNSVKFLQVHGSELNCRWCGKSCSKFKCSSCPSKFCSCLASPIESLNQAFELDSCVAVSINHGSFWTRRECTQQRANSFLTPKLQQCRNTKYRSGRDETSATANIGNHHVCPAMVKVTQQSGQLTKCQVCGFDVEQSCILRNFGSKKLCEVQNKSIWNCFICNIKDLWPHRAICWAIQGYLREQKRAYDDMRKKGVRHGLEYLLEKDSSQCCTAKPSVSAVPPPPPTIPISSSPPPLKFIGSGTVNRTSVSQQAKPQYVPLHNGQTSCYINTSNSKTPVQAQSNYASIPANCSPPKSNHAATNSKHSVMQSNVIVVDDDDVQCLTPVEDKSIWLRESIELSVIQTQSIANAFKDFETRIHEGNNSVTEISDLTKRLRRLLHSSVSELREIDMNLAKNFNSWAKNKFVNLKKQRQAELDSLEQESGIPDSLFQQSMTEGSDEINLKTSSSNHYLGHCNSDLYNHSSSQISPPVKIARRRNPQQKRNVAHEIKKEEVKYNGVLPSVHISSFNFKESPAHQYYKMVYAKLFKAHNIRDCRVVVERSALHLHKV